LYIALWTPGLFGVAFWLLTKVFAVVVSRTEILTASCMAEVAVAGLLDAYNLTVTESAALVARAVTVNEAAVVVSDLTAPLSPEINVAVPSVGVEIAVFETVAVEGDTDISPSPNAETTTSAKRLKFVLLDICFLSKVDPETIPGSAGEEKLFAS
jgi:hypothetical protein